ncbi:hypothetical protein JDV02_002937 [Purpureocillium takamizusanense]|uniref:Uncharacterized protein n=1 Tax=Purpureocillium takamizusanense TaxID=2060973 RepID=A0A9Q8QAH7_9HYPO|nr:uncharacterized protein JDV02_002937 [Purpureocillium takamizusanense]UNI16508.1 hypothetical protein JDV02_002937 [Purpureocillium takamizusanense]
MGRRRDTPREPDGRGRHHDERQIIVIGNSIDGSSEDYLARLRASRTAVTSQLPRPHRDDDCAEAFAHARKLRAADHERLVRAAFGAHPSYCIALKEDRQGTEQDAISDLLGPAGASKGVDTVRLMWEGGAAELGALGGGRESLATFCWQHVFADSRRGLAERL